MRLSIYKCGYLLIDAAIYKIDFLKFNLLSNGLIEKFWDALWLGIGPFLRFICNPTQPNPTQPNPNPTQPNPNPTQPQPNLVTTLGASGGIRRRVWQKKLKHPVCPEKWVLPMGGW